MYDHLPYGPTAALSQTVMPGPSNPTLCDGKSLIKFDGKNVKKFDGKSQLTCDLHIAAIPPIFASAGNNDNVLSCCPSCMVY